MRSLSQNLVTGFSSGGKLTRSLLAGAEIAKILLANSQHTYVRLVSSAMKRWRAFWAALYPGACLPSLSESKMRSLDTLRSKDTEILGSLTRR